MSTSEGEKDSSSVFGREWVFLGEYPGQKTEDLLAFAKSAPFGLRIPSGISLGASYFNEFIEYHRAKYGGEASFYSYYGEVSPKLRGVNEWMVQYIPPGDPVAVRSSAMDESGGTGIYDSCFYFPSPNLLDFEWREKIVYASYLAKRAQQYQRPREITGMGLLIQPVVGSWHANNFMPALSGVLTFIDGKPVARIVMGLGTRAVGLNRALVLKDDEVTLTNVCEGLEAQPYTDALVRSPNRKSEMIENEVVPDSLRQAALGQAPKLLDLIKIWRELANNHQSYYWEFAIDPSEKLPCVLQSSQEIMPSFVPSELPEPEGRVLLEGQDMVNKGIKTGSGIFLLKDRRDAKDMAEWNNAHKNYIVLTSELTLSTAQAHGPLPFHVFSNAAAFIELQKGRLHTGVGGSHFAEVCKRRDVLFLGGRIPEEEFDFQRHLGDPSAKIGSSSLYWDIKYKVTNTTSGGRLEIMQPPLKNAPVHIKDIHLPIDKQTTIAERFDRIAEELDNVRIRISAAGQANDEVLDSFYNVAWFIEKAGLDYKESGNFLAYVTSLQLEEIVSLYNNLLNVLNLHGHEDFAPGREFRFIKDNSLEDFLFDVFNLCKERISSNKAS